MNLKTVITHGYVFLIMFFSGILVSCSSDKTDMGYLSDGFRLDFATVRLENAVPVLALDNKDTLRDKTITSFGFTKKDGQRVLVNYSPAEGNSMAIHSVSDILTSRIFTARLDTLGADPVKIQSIWIAGGYLNLILYMDYYSKKHQFGLYRSQQSPNALYLSHDKQGDSQGYPLRIYMSFYLNGLQKTDDSGTSLSVSIPTASGIKDYHFTFL